MEENRNSRKAILTSILNWVTALSSLAIALVGIFALVIAQKQIVEMHDEAKIQHLTAFVDKFDSPEQATIRRNLALKRVDQTSKSKRLRQYEPGTPPVEFDEELGFCNDLGLLTEHGYLDRHDVWSAFGQWLFYLYGDARPYLDNLISQADTASARISWRAFAR